MKKRRKVEKVSEIWAFYGTGSVLCTVPYSNRTHTEKNGFCQSQILKQKRKPTIFEAQLVLGAARENVKLELSDTPAIIITLWY